MSPALPPLLPPSPPNPENAPRNQQTGGTRLLPLDPASSARNDSSSSWGLPRARSRARPSRSGAACGGTAAATRRTQLVPDVDAFPGHIACDGDSRSEIVVPVVVARARRRRRRGAAGWSLHHRRRAAPRSAASTRPTGGGSRSWRRCWLRGVIGEVCVGEGPVESGGGASERPHGGSVGPRALLEKTHVGGDYAICSDDHDI